MGVEVIANLWTFVKNKLAFEIGARLYMVDGDDDQKFAFLQALAPHDFHLAHRFRIPDNYSVTLVDGGSSKTFKGLTQPMPDDYLGLFGDAWDPLKASIPEHKIGIQGSSSSRAPLVTNNLLTVNTYVEVDSAGNAVSNIPNPAFAGKSPRLMLNRWAFVDSDSSRVFATASRAYLAVGDDEQLDRLAATLAPHDHALARRFPIAASRGVVNGSEVASKSGLFEEAIRGIQEEIPVARLDWITEKTTKYTFQPEQAQVKTSLVTENDQSQVSISDAGSGLSTPTSRSSSAATSVPEPKQWWEFWK